MGNLEPGPLEEWLILAHKGEQERAVQLELDIAEPDRLVDEIVGKARALKTRQLAQEESEPEAVSALSLTRCVEECREAGACGQLLLRQVRHE